MDIYIGNNQRVVLSGSVIVMGDDPIRFSLNSNFIVVFRFERNTSVKEKSRRHEIVNNELVITFVNYEDALWVSNAIQEQLGTFQGKPLFMNFALSYVGTAECHSRIVSYTFSQGA